MKQKLEEIQESVLTTPPVLTRWRVPSLNVSRTTMQRALAVLYMHPYRTSLQQELCWATIIDNIVEILIIDCPLAWFSDTLEVVHTSATDICQRLQFYKIFQNSMTWLLFEPWTITSVSHELNHPAKKTLILHALFYLVLGNQKPKNHNEEYQRCLRL